MKVKCDVWRSDPGAGAQGSYSTYVLNVDPAETVLGILVKINHDLDAGLAFRFACGVVKCGECALEVNGSPCLACEKAVEEEMRIRPLPGLPLIKDLVIDRRAVFDRVLKLIPQLVRIRESTTLRGLGADDMDRFVGMTKCFECLMCQSACPVHSNSEEKFAGPLGLLWLGQMSVDPAKRPLIKNEIDASLEMCLRCGACSEACPSSEDIIGLAIDTLEKGVQGG
ncbi:MAG: 2Fe-2S iron-sulfur cluster-binding protein [Syntrophorhabdales bacterium]|jgi:succinate dehydrogenase/fumarate reductase iron-sulfur protein